METKPLESPAKSTRARGMPLLLLGVLLFFAGPVAYAIQVQMRHLTTPWYVPMLMTIGLLLVIAWVLQTRGILRIVAAIPFLLLYAFMWVALLGMYTPRYEGPLHKSGKFPKFHTKLADGSTFTDLDLETGTPSVLVFFRGHW